MGGEGFCYGDWCSLQGGFDLALLVKGLFEGSNFGAIFAQPYFGQCFALDILGAADCIPVDEPGAC